MPERSGNEEPSKNSLEFRASIIPYDTCEDPNAPILASSGDNINLIFNIPKESFRKLAVAAIAHLDSNSDFEPAGTFSGSKESDNNKCRKSRETSKFRSSDVVKNLESENTEDIIDSYEEDGNESESSKKDEISADPKLCVNGNSNASLEVYIESVPNDYETEKLIKNGEMANFQKSSNDLETAFAVSEKNADTSRKISNLESICDSLTEGKSNEKGHSDTVDIINGNLLKYDSDDSNDKETESEKNKDSHNRDGHKISLTKSPKQHAVNKELNCGESGNEGDRVEVLSDQSLDLSHCPELENAWPDIHPFTKTEKIPIEAMESFILNGSVTKYFKLELSSEFVMIKVTSESNVFVDAVKYKETEKGSTLETGGNSKDSNEDDEYKACETSSESSENKSADETLEGDSLDNFLEDSEFEEMSLKIEEKLEGLDANVPGSSPTARLKFTLRESLKISSSEIDSKKQKEVSVANFSQNLSENFDSKENASESDNFQIKEKSLEDSLNKCVTESSKIYDSNEMTRESHENKTEYTNEPNAEIESPKTGSKQDSISPEKRPIYNSSNKDESGNVTEDSAVAGKTSPSDNFKNENFLCYVEETNIDKKSFSQPTEEKNSFEDSALGKDLHLSENDVPNDCYKLLNDMECKEASSQEMSSSIPCEIEENESKGTDNEIPDNAADVNCTSKNNHDLQNEQCEEAVVEENCCVAEIVTESTKLEIFENSLAANIAEEKDLSENTSTDDKTSAENSNEIINAGESNDELNDVEKEIKTENAPENLIADKNIEVNLNEVSELESGEAERSEKSLEPNSEYMEDSVSETTDIEEKLPEKSFASNVDTFMDTTDDKTCAENSYETNKASKSNYKFKNVEKVKIENAPETLITGKNIEVNLNEVSELESGEAYSERFEKSLEPNSEYLEDSVSEITDIEEKLPENSFASNVDSFMDTTVEANVESASECGDLESDDVKSVASESDDSKDSDKQSSIRRYGFKKNRKADEVDCAPTRTRRKKEIPGLSKDAIPENTELKTTKASSRHTTLDTPSKYSGRISPIGRSLRSKSLDPTPQSSKGNGSIVESEESTRRTRAKTPDIIGKKDLKTTARSSPRKIARSSTITEPSSASKVQSTKTSVADSKARANLDFPVSKKRSKRGSKD